MSSAVPDGWSVYALGELGQVVGGGTPPSETLSYWGGSVMWATPAEITKLKSRYINKTLRTITKEGLQKSSAKLHPKGTILLTSRASIGYPAINSVPMATNQGFQSLRPNEKLDVEYGYQLILNNRNGLERLSAGSTFLEISSKEINKYKLPIPPLPEQKKIASILTSVDEVIENTQKQIDKLQDLKKATMNELLTKGIGHTEFKDSELGRIPKSWEVSTVNNLFPKVVVGYVGNVNNYYCDSSEGVSFYRTQNVRPNKFLLKTDVYVTKEFHSKNKKSSIKNGDVLISRVGANLGMICMVDGLEKEANAANVIVIKQTKYYSSKFLSIFLNSDIGQKNIFLDVIGGAQDVYNTNTAKSLLIPVPPKKEVDDIVDIISAIENNISNKKNKLAQIESLKKSLMKDLLTGKVRVSVN